ncbi:MAG: TonB family protein [Candidatus Polarisedimenticolia bacterium]
MKIAVRMARQDEAEAILMKLAGASAVVHVVALAAFSILPRLTQPTPMPRAIVAEIVPASALSLPGPAPTPKPSGPTPTQRAEAARRAQKPAPDPTTPPLEARPKTKAKKPEPQKPEKPSPPQPKPEPEKPAPEQSEEPPPEPVEEPKPDQPDHGITFGGSTGPGGVPSIGSSAFPYDYYRSSLVSILQSNWRRPVAPEGLTQTLTARVQFTILKSGIVQDPRLVERSGNDALDQSALRAVYDSNPLPPLPFQYGHASVSAEVVFELTSD